MEKTFVAEIERLDEVLQWIQLQLSAFDVDLKTLKKVELASEEVIVNIIKHGYMGKSGHIQIEILKTADQLVLLKFKDRGPPFDPLKFSEPNLSSNLDDRSIGGLGIFFVKKNIQTISYSFESGQNILSFTIRALK